MKYKNSIIKFNNLIANKKLRLFISLLAIGHGIIRLSEGAKFTSVSFGSEVLFGILLIVLGTLLGITSITILRHRIYSYVTTALLASLYAVLACAIIGKNIGSAFTMFMIVIFLLIEEVFIYER